MIIYKETVEPFAVIKEWNCCHPSGYAGNVVEFTYTDKTVTRYFYTDGFLHRCAADGPATECFYSNGALRSFTFYSKGRIHRPLADGPAHQSFYLDSVKAKEEFWVNGRQVFP